MVYLASVDNSLRNSGITRAVFMMFLTPKIQLVLGAAGVPNFHFKRQFLVLSPALCC